MHIQTIHIYGDANDSKNIGKKREGRFRGQQLVAHQSTAMLSIFLQCTILFTCEYLIHNEVCLTLVFLHAHFMRILPRFS